MAIREQDDLPYRSPVTTRQAAPRLSIDESEYSTLKEMHREFSDAIAGLSRDFNLFDVLTEGTDEAKKDHMMRLIAGKQIAYDILMPVLQAFTSALERADANFKRRNEK